MKIGMLIRRFSYKHRLRVAVKEAFDTLPTAVCYFTDIGMIKLCNAAMYRIFREIAQSDLQCLEELNDALDNCDSSTGIVRDGNVFIFPNGSTWQYSSEKVRTADGEIYTEVMFNDVTDLYVKRQELQQQSRELKKMYRELKVLSDNVLKMIREREILNMKSRLHDQMNMGLSAIRQILRKNSTYEENDTAIMQFRRAIQVLQKETAYTKDAVMDFIRDAAVSGVKVSISGELPKEEELLHRLLPVMWESCVNATRHADASNLYITVERTQDAVTLSITNDGKQPEGEITPMGGLVDLGKRITETGGKIEIQSQPEFMLTVTLPVNKQEQEE